MACIVTEAFIVAKTIFGPLKILSNLSLFIRAATFFVVKKAILRYDAARMKKIEKALAQYWGFETFLPLQRQAMECIRRKDVDSMCAQLESKGYNVHKFSRSTIVTLPIGL